MISPAVMNKAMFWEQKWFLIILTAGTAYVGYFVKDVIEKRNVKKRKKKRDRMYDGMKAQANVFRSIDTLKKISSVGIVYLLEIANNGERPQAGTKLYARIIDIQTEQKNKDREYYMTHYGKFELDEHYINLVLKVTDSQESQSFRLSGSEECLLRTICIAEGVQFVDTYHIYSDVNKWRQYVLGVCSTTHDGSEFSAPKTKAVIDTNVNHIRLNFKLSRE